MDFRLIKDSCCITVGLVISMAVSTADTIDYEIDLRDDRIAKFRLWLPEGDEEIRSVVTLAPGLRGDARGQAESEISHSLTTGNRPGRGQTWLPNEVLGEQWQRIIRGE